MNRSTHVLSIAALVGLSGALALAQTEKQAPSPGLPSGHPQIPVPQVGEEWPKADPADVGTIDAIMTAFYESPGGAPGEARNWDRYKSLFVPSARLIPARPGAEGTSGAYFLPVADYIEANKVYFEKGGFWDSEVARRTEAFGNIVHVWSTYESRRTNKNSEPYSRGINSIQLLKDGDRYWIVGVFWDYERPDNPVPEKYLSTPSN